MFVIELGKLAQAPMLLENKEEFLLSLEQVRDVGES